MLTKLQRHPSTWYSAHNLNCQGCLLFPWLIHCLLIANNASLLVNGGHELATYHISLKLILQWNLAPFCVHEGVIMGQYFLHTIKSTHILILSFTHYYRF